MRVARRAVMGAAIACALPASARAQVAAPPLPFAPGERLTYEVRTSRFGGVGRGTMWVEGPAEVRGRDAWVLRFDFEARVGPVKAEDRTTSWLDATLVRSLRYRKHERHPLSRHDEDVELDPDTRSWRGADGTSGQSPTDRPLDELSFMYFLRTLPIDMPDGDWRFDRHYAADRNPTLVRVVGHEDVDTPAGRFHAVQLEMRVKDARRYQGDGTIHVDLTDDACRIPVRIESRMPVIGSAVMLLTGHNVRGCEAALASN